MNILNNIFQEVRIMRNIDKFRHLEISGAKPFEHMSDESILGIFGGIDCNDCPQALKCEDSLKCYDLISNWLHDEVKK